MSEIRNTWQKTPIILIGILVILGTILYILGGSEESDVSLDETQNAISELLSGTSDQFTRSSEQNIDGILPAENITPLTGAEDDPVIGTSEGILTIVEFSDFECPFCKAAFPIIREFTSRHTDTVRYIYRDFPVEEIHENARNASIAASCAASQDKFWQYHDRLFQNQSDLSSAALLSYAESSGIDIASFRKCIVKSEINDEIDEDLKMGRALGVKGTPTWFINGEKIEGVIPLEVWEEILGSVSL